MSETKIELADMLSSMFADQARSKPAKREPMADQAAKLRGMLKDYNTTYAQFYSGDLVRLKDGLGTIKDESRPTMAMMFWRDLDENNYQDRLIVKRYLKKLAIDRVDCLVAHIADDGVSLVPIAMNTRDLEPWEP